MIRGIGSDAAGCRTSPLTPLPEGGGNPGTCHWGAPLSLWERGWGRGFALKSRALALALLLMPGLALADDRADIAGALAAACVTPLEERQPMAEGLERAPEAMAAQLLNGKDATLWRHANPKIVVVAHNSGETCEIMGIGFDMGDVAVAVRGWAAEADYTIAEGENMDRATGGGAYLVRALEPDYVQIFVHTDAPRGFVGITAGRVKVSAQAEEVLGE